MKRFIFIYCAIASMCNTSCMDYLNEKPDMSLAVPTTAKDLQALLDNFSNLSASEPNLGEISTDDYFLSAQNWASTSIEENRRLYLWENYNTVQSSNTAWTGFSQTVYYSNTVIEASEALRGQTILHPEYHNILGQALYHRAKAWLQAAYIWCNAYDKATSNQELGLPLRMGTDFNPSSVRSNLEATYAQITNDLKSAAYLLPEKPLHPKRPSKAAAFGALARAYLSMREYDDAGRYADSCLAIQGTLMDFNKLDNSLARPIPQFNEEVIMDALIPITQIINPSRAWIKREIYELYDDHDLRKEIFFNQSGNEVSFRSGYTGTLALFGGIATDEMYLIRSEALIRAGNVEEGMAVLNELLEMRYLKGHFSPLKATSLDSALSLIITERRKELLMRGIRWHDVKRLNKEGWNITLTRTLDGMEYRLPPNDPRYAILIPEDIVALSGMQQNPR